MYDYLVHHLKHLETVNFILHQLLLCLSHVYISKKYGFNTSLAGTLHLHQQIAREQRVYFVYGSSSLNCHCGLPTLCYSSTTKGSFAPHYVSRSLFSTFPTKNSVCKSQTNAKISFSLDSFMLSVPM
jgi:hypothetical protein